MTRTAPPRALHAIIFDFDGVIANSEPLHLRAFQATLAVEGISLSDDEYYSQYLGYDDVGAFRELAKNRGYDWNERHVAALVAFKGVKLQELLEAGAVLFPGAAEFIRESAASVPIAIASGALPHEIREIVDAAGLASLFTTIVGAGDTAESKPSPEPYLRAFAQLRTATGMNLDPARSVAIEDSRWGLASARAAGLRCVGVTTSYPARDLPGAELTVSGLAELTLEMLDALCLTPHGERSR